MLFVFMLISTILEIAGLGLIFSIVGAMSPGNTKSGLFIDKNDILYSADSESNNTWGANPGWKRGIRIGSARDGMVTAFIPDPEPDPDNAGTTAAEGVMVDDEGNIYGAEVGPSMVKKYVKN